MKSDLRKSSAPKRLLQRLYWATDDQIRLLRIKALVRSLKRAQLSRPALLSIVAQLRQTWGNTNYSADLGFLEEIVVAAMRPTGPFLECGSGLSTVVLGVLAQRNGVTVWSLEQDIVWSRAMWSRLAALGLSNVYLLHAPLELKDGGVWYGFDAAAMPRAFSTVFCDGPAVRKSQWPAAAHRAWRSRLVEELRQRGITFGKIVLDDAEDARSPDLIEAWRRAGLIVEIVECQFGRHIVATQPHAESTGGHPFT
jgi:hypothetical protein